MTKLTKAQQKALYNLWLRAKSSDTFTCPAKTYLQYRRLAMYNEFLDCLMIGFCGMIIGIEKDGYTHS